MVVFNFLLILILNVLINLVFMYKNRIKSLEKRNDEIWARYFKVTHFLNHTLTDKQKNDFDNFLDRGF